MWRRSWGWASSAVLLLATLTVPARAATVDPAPATPAGVPVTVTLVTGDVVTYVSDPVGRDTVSVVSPPRPDIGYEVYDRADGWYVLPSDAADAVRDGQVDEDLFNVTYLATNGYGERPTLPVIMDYEPGRVEAAAALPASTPTRQLSSVDAVALEVDKANTGQLWQALLQQRGEGTLLLDRVVTANLAESVAQVKAPQAWAGGLDGGGVRVAVLDTGYDSAHPDLAGKVVEEKSFIPYETDLVDRHGHGTHVASTIAGSGAASGGAEKGVAPGAGLVVGKVLDRSGMSYGSSVLAGMEWAATRADVVNMSLGGPPPIDTKDLLAEAVTRLTAETGTLFVVAAGNSGPNINSVSSPGVAPEALTVGAVDSADTVAGFSGRGPTDTGAVKPEITAPGVAITAARSATGTHGTPVDQYYSAMSGTSMATPHVAGAAAILAQQHPDWSAAALKSALIASTEDTGAPVNDQGAGRLDVEAATTQEVTADPPVVNFGELAAPHGTSEKSTLTYHNSAGEELTLDLATRMTNASGEPIDGVLTTSTDTVTVPAHGSATVDVTIHPGKAPTNDSYQGLVTATGGATTVTTPVGFANGEVAHVVTFHVIGFDGKPLDFSTGGKRRLTVLPLDLPSNDRTLYDVPATPSMLKLPVGKYFLALTLTGEKAGGISASALLVDQEVAVSKATDVTFDLRATKRVELGTQDPVHTDSSVFGFTRTSATGMSASWKGGVGLFDENLYVSPTPAARIGTFSFEYGTHAVRAPLDVTVGRVTVHPRYDSQPISGAPVPVAKFTGRSKRDLVHVGAGTAADFAAAGDLRGKLVLARSTPGPAYAQVAVLAHQANAAGLLLFTDAGPPSPPTISSDLLPIGFLERPDGLRLLDALSGGRGRATLSGQPASPYAYHLSFTTPTIAKAPTYAVRTKDLTRFDTTYHSSADQVVGTGFTKGGNQLVPAVAEVEVPATRTEYFGPTTDHATWMRLVTIWQDGRYEAYTAPAADLAAGRRYTEEWFEAPARYGQGDHFNIPTQPAPYLATRTTGAIHVLPWLLDSGGHVSAMAPNAKVVSTTLRRDGITLPGVSGKLGTTYAVPPGGGSYQLDLSYRPGGDHRVDTTWKVTSPAPDGAPSAPDHQCASLTSVNTSPKPCEPLPTISMDYDLDLSDRNTAPAPGKQTIRVLPHHTGGTDTAITSAALSVSYDGGTTWTKVKTKRDRDGWLTGTIAHHRPGQTVSLRVEARDAAGNTVTQTTLNAYRTTARG